MALPDFLVGLSAEVLVFIAALPKRRREDLLESLQHHGEEVSDRLTLAAYAANWGIHPQFLPLFVQYMP